MLPAHVLVAGAGVSGAGAARLLHGLGVKVTVVDDDAAARDRVAAVSSGTCATSAARGLLGDVDLVVTSPGWRPDTPLLVDAAGAGLEVIGDVELAWRLDRAGHFGPPRTWLAVTGTNGKTTTTGMLAAMLQADRRAAAAVGNIGVAVADALSGPERVDVLAAELSSFQLHWAPTLRPDAGAVLNLADDHLDWHGGFAAYAAAKARALRGPVAVAGIDDAKVRELVGDRPVTGFTLGEPAAGQVGVRAGEIVDATVNPPVALAPAEGIDPPGPAGVLDALAAAALARSQGVSPQAVAAGLSGFHVAAHRGQTVLRADGVRWLDNSKATNPHAALAALRGLEHIVWIAGGQLKGAAVDSLVTALAGNLDAAVVLGADRAVLAEALARLAPEVPVRVIDSTDPVAAMDAACAAAAGFARRGATVALAPAAASLDMYRGMGQRGELFAAAARRLAGPGAPKAPPHSAVPEEDQ